MFPFMSILKCTKIFPLITMAFGLSETDTLTAFIIISIIINTIFMLYIAMRLVIKLMQSSKARLSLKW